MQRAREATARHAGRARGAHLRARHLPTSARGIDGEKLDRFDQALEVYVGKKQVYYPQPMLLNYPELPPVQFHDRDLFPWLPQLEAATDDIREELMAVLEAEWKEFRPYIEYPKGAPVAQWYELNHSPRWSSFFLWENGVRNDAHCDALPEDRGGAGVPADDRPAGLCAQRHVLGAAAEDPHPAAHRLDQHPPGRPPASGPAGKCGFRVGNDTRDWKMGEAWVFDDTIEHEAWNESDHVRVVLIFDVWNPYLSQAERELVSAMMTAKNAWMAAETRG